MAPIVKSTLTTGSQKPSHLAKFRRVREQQLQGTQSELGWHEEMQRYFKDPFPHVTEKTDLIELWQVCNSIFILLQPAADVLIYSIGHWTLLPHVPSDGP